MQRQIPLRVKTTPEQLSLGQRFLTPGEQLPLGLALRYSTAAVRLKLGVKICGRGPLYGDTVHMSGMLVPAYIKDLLNKPGPAAREQDHGRV